MNYSIGVALGHSSAAVLLKGSEIIYAIEKEKIARVKGLTSFPSLSINYILNKRLNRTEFMPFAPMIIDTDAKTFLKNYTIDNIASRYMTVTYDIKSSLSKKIKGSIHIDNTARPQVLFKEDNLEMYNILKEYKKLSKVGVLLNTSFNLHEEPIIDSPILGIIALEKGAIDILSVENYLIYGNEN